MKTKILLLFGFFIVGFFSFPNLASAECQLRDIYPAVELNKPITNIPIPYSEGESLTAKVKTKQNFNCEDFQISFRVCPIVSGSLACDQSILIGSFPIKNSDVTASWTVRKLSGVDRYRIRAVVGTLASGCTQGDSSSRCVSEVRSPEILIRSGQTCAITNFIATRNGNSGPVNFVISSNSQCEGRDATVQIFTQPGGANAQIPGDIVSRGKIAGNRYSGSWNGTPSTNNFFFRGAVSGGGTMDSVIFVGGQPVPPGGQQPQPPTDSGQGQSFLFDIPNPLKGGADDLAGLVKVIAQWLFNLAIPIAVVMIIYAGVLFLTAQGNPTAITKAKDVLKWAVVGLAIILIGSGFVTLIQSILELGAPSSGQPTLPAPGGQGGTQPSVGAVGNRCSRDRDCFTGLKCRNSICQRATGNLIGEPCNGGTNCVSGLACDRTSATSVIIDGQTLGTCYQP